MVERENNLYRISFLQSPYRSRFEAEGIFVHNRIILWRLNRGREKREREVLLSQMVTLSGSILSTLTFVTDHELDLGQEKHRNGDRENEGTK